MRTRTGLAALALLAAACATSPLPEPVPYGARVGDLRGTWRGTWGGAPAALLITDQQASGGSSGVFAGNARILGHEPPGVSGILTSRVNDAQTSVTARVWFGGVEGGLALWIVADSPEGQQRMLLRPDGPDRLVGMGDSSIRRGPAGPIELTRAR